MSVTEYAMPNNYLMLNQIIEQLDLIDGIIFYSLFRFSLEFFREPDSQLGLFFEFFSMGQFLCIPMIVVGAFIYLKKNK